MAASNGSLRDRYLAFIARHEVAWELAFAGLAIVFVVAGFAFETAAVTVLETGLTFVFVAEFLTRLGAAYERRAYLRAHWIDLVAIIPTTRAFRLLRLLRLLRLVRAFAGVYRALSTVDAIARHRGLAALFAAWGAVMVICSLALYAAENGTNKAVESPLDALWWGVVTLTTVGYGDVYPITPEGRLAASVLMLLGIGLFSAITATVTSYMLTDDRGGATTVVEDLARLAALRDSGALSDTEYATAKARVLADTDHGVGGI